MRSTLPLPANRGFTLHELLIAMSVVSIVMAAAGGLFVVSRNFITDQIVRLETLQALRSSLDNFARDFRLGGACLPTNGDFMALSGINSGTIDGVTTRTGLVQPNLTCVRTSITTALNKADTQIKVNSTAGFLDNMRVYARNTDGTGEVFNITTVSNSTTLLKNTVLTRDYTVTAGIYAIDERQYAIDTSNSALPVLTIAINGAAPTPFAYGIESVNVQYELAQNCPACTVRDLPQNATEWTLVNQLYISVTARSRTKASDGQYYRVSGKISAKPRNLLPG